MQKFYPNKIYHRIICCGGERLSFGMFENMLLVEMESSKLNNYFGRDLGEPTIQLR
jgi:hypothetical protein